MANTKITKAHIIAHLVSTLGPQTRATLLKMTCQIEGKPYRPASNNSYFQPHADPSSHTKRCYPSVYNSSLLVNGTLKVVGKQGNSLVYGLDVRGARLAAEYLDAKS